MTWEETTPGVYKAELGGAEKIYRQVAILFAHLKREHYRVHCICRLDFGPEFRGRDPATALKEAWKALRTELPALSVLLDGPTQKVYRVLDAQGEQDWLHQTFFVEPLGKTSDAVIAREPSNFPTLHFLPSSSEVVFLCSHWRIDAVGTNWVLDQLFTLLANPPITPYSGPSLDAVSPALEEALGIPDSWTPEQEDDARSFIRSFRDDSFPNDRMRYKGDATTLPGDPARQTLVLDPTSTTALVTSCKTHKISVTAATHSALAQTVFALADNEKREPAQAEKHDYTCATSINLRPKLPPPYNTRAHAVQTYLRGVACRVKRDSSFVDAATALTRHYKEAYRDDRALQCIRAAYKLNNDATPAQQKRGEDMLDTAEAPTHGPRPSPPVVSSSPPPPPPSGITISSLGVVDHYLTGEYGGREGGAAVRVQEYHFGIEMMTRQMVLYVGTFQGRLQLEISYNAGYYDADVPLDILSRVHRELERGLGVQLMSDSPPKRGTPLGWVER
ncbi:MAG: hypothetical protein Q9157_004189 [Trypethelium eluteriae]